MGFGRLLFFVPFVQFSTSNCVTFYIFISFFCCCSSFHRHLPHPNSPIRFHLLLFLLLFFSQLPFCLLFSPFWIHVSKVQMRVCSRNQLRHHALSPLPPLRLPLSSFSSSFAFLLFVLFLPSPSSFFFLFRLVCHSLFSFLFLLFSCFSSSFSSTASLLYLPCLPLLCCIQSRVRSLKVLILIMTWFFGSRFLVPGGGDEAAK